MNSYIKYNIAQEKQNILNYLRERKTKLNEDGIIELGLFGSFAKDEADLASDVDICIKSTDIFYKKYLGFEAVIYLDELREEFVRKFKRQMDICDEADILELFNKNDIRGLKAIRNIASHDYEGLNLAIIEEIIRYRLPPIREKIALFLERQDNPLRSKDILGFIDENLEEEMKQEDESSKETANAYANRIRKK